MEQQKPIPTDDHPCISPTLIWKEQLVKDLFASRQWPTFIGVPPPVMQTKNRSLLTAEQALQQQVDGNQKQAMPLPVLVWKEQTFGIDTSSQQKNLPPSNKRKRAVTEESNPSSDQTIAEINEQKMSFENHENQDQQQSKRVRVEERDDWSISSLPRTLGSFCWRQMIRVFSIFSPPSTSSGDGPIKFNMIESNAHQSSPLVSHEIEAINIRKSTRQVVYEDLRNRGYFVGPGDVYGGDYCIYKGKDPSQSHSVATIRVCNGKVSAKDLLSFSRVQNQVAKSAVFAFQHSTIPSSSTSANANEIQNDEKVDSVGYVVFNFRAVSVRC